MLCVTVVKIQGDPMGQRRLEPADQGQACQQSQRSTSRGRGAHRPVIIAFINTNDNVNLNNSFMK